MKRTALFLILLLATINLMASNGIVVLQRGELGEGWIGDDNNVIPTPRVTYNDTSITISCDSMLTEVGIVVKDMQGNVMIEDTVVLNHTYTLYHEPETLVQRRYEIELYLDDRHYYYGFFTM